MVARRGWAMLTNEHAATISFALPPAAAPDVGPFPESGVIEFRQVTLEYPATHTLALDNLTVSVTKGEFVYLVGHSGAGKSSFMNLILKRALPTRGEVRVAGQPLSHYRGRRTPLLRRHMGTVFQDNLLLSHLNAYDNVAFALRVIGVPGREWPERVSAALRLVGLEHKKHALPMQLSLGEQQRVAIARAVAKRPELLLCDEPTGALDYRTGKLVLEVIEKVNRELGTTTLVITHNVSISGMADRIITLRSGEVVEDRRNEKKISPSELSW